MADYQFFELRNEAGYDVLTINRPEALNALNKELLTEFNTVIDDLEKTDSRVLIITGSGKAFVAGADIAQMKDLDAGGAAEFARFGQSTFDKLQNSKKVVIAAVNGFALGGGLELALACDIRYASTKAKLGLPEVTLGLVPGFGGSQRLPRVIGKGLAFEYIVSGNMVDAETALSHGLVNIVKEPDELLPATEELAKKILANGPIAVATAKNIIHTGVDGSQTDGLKLEADSFGDLFGGGESKEGMTAFLEKRKANF